MYEKSKESFFVYIWKGGGCYIDCVMRVAKGFIYVLNQMEDCIVFVVCIVCMLLGMYCLYDNYLTYSGATDDSLLKYKPGYDNVITEQDKEIQGNMVAWLDIDDTAIDYPIMQGKTNTEYLNINPYGEYSSSGSIFLDFRNASDFSDKYSLIYGHHMEGDVMFGTLDNYLDETYFNQHRNGTLFVGDVVYDYHIFAVVDTEATNSFVFNPTETDVYETWEFIASNAIYFDEKIADEEKSLLALSTCRYPDTTERTVVFGVLDMKEGN